MAGRRDTPRATVMRALGLLGFSEAELARLRSVVITPDYISAELFRLNVLGGALRDGAGRPTTDVIMIMIAGEAPRPPIRVGPAKTGPHLNAAGRTGEGA